MAKRKILCVHGVGHHPIGGSWEQDWREAIRAGTAGLGFEAEPIIDFVHYDDIFEDYDISFWDSLEAFGKLTASAVTSPFRRARGGNGSLRWTAGMVVQWVENEELRKRTRERITRRIEEFKPHLIAAHSLGSLVCYDALTDGPLPAAAKSSIFMSFGSQIGNPFVSGNFLAGRIAPLETRHWYHLYNDEDAVFAAPIRLNALNFQQVDTDFDLPGIADHDATAYLGHPRTREVVWSRLALETRQRRLFKPTRSRQPAWTKKPKNRALLVGINNYPAESMRLEGCVNDVYLMSSALQDSGFKAEDIRIVLDERATAGAVLERLDWLLAGAEPEDNRVFYYSGHGAQLPSYGLGDRIDRMDEALVTYDFDWDREDLITDDRFYHLYSQLPYGLNFLTIFDCCHSGGMTRDGSMKIRGLTPPDDIRHRAMRWDSEAEVWKPRRLTTTNQEFLDKHSAEPRDKSRSAPQRSTHRLGYSMALRRLDEEAYKKTRKQRRHLGPFFPLLMYACREDQYAYEYRHGATAYGAFTYSLVKNLRRARRSAKKALTFAALMKTVEQELADLHFDQKPVLEGPKALKGAAVPFL